MIIYKITFPNGKEYVGQTVETLNTRISHHRTDAKRERDITKYSQSGSKIGNAIRKYGLKKEWFNIIDSAKTIEELNEKEIYWINYYNTKNNGYNIKPGGKNKKHSEETKEKIGVATKERWGDKEVAVAMKKGLEKATQTWKDMDKKERERVKREIKICPICRKKFESRPKENKIYCSRQCSAKNASFVAADKKKNKSKSIKEERKDKILQWALNNKQLILDCSYNKISSNLKPIQDLLKISDWRTITSSLSLTSRKKFLDYLKNYVKIYAEPTGEQTR